MTLPFCVTCSPTQTDFYFYFSEKKDFLNNLIPSPRLLSEELFFPSGYKFLYIKLPVTPENIEIAAIETSICVMKRRTFKKWAKHCNFFFVLDDRIKTEWDEKRYNDRAVFIRLYFHSAVVLSDKIRDGVVECSLPSALFLQPGIPSRLRISQKILSSVLGIWWCAWSHKRPISFSARMREK